MIEKYEQNHNEEKHGNGLSNQLQDEAADELSSSLKISGDRAEMLDSMTWRTVGTRIGDTNPDADMSVTVMVRSKASMRELDETLQKVLSHEIDPLTNDEFIKRFGADPESMQRVLKFAHDYGLTVDESDTNSGRILLKGTAQKFSGAFRVKLSDYQCDDGSIAHERTGTISVPREVGTDIQGVLGLDNRPVVKPLSRQQEVAGPNPVTQTGAFYPDQVAKAYDFPTESMGQGQSVGIIELGGTLDLDDNAQYYKDHGWKLPNIQIVTVDDVKPHHESDFDEETAVDSQIIGAVAPDAKQQIIFTKKSFQGFIDGITRATNPQEGELQNSAISISYGARESDWDAQSLTNMDLALKKAALKGISILVAAGDAGAEDLNSGDRADGTFQADYPASDPWVTACAGTHLELDAEGKPKEEVWNEKTFKATGGGVSHEFEKPDYQKDIQVPENPNPHASDPKLHGVVDPKSEWRGVPDVAGNAASSSGYWLRLDHKENVHYGTSAVAPLYAALVMRINGALGKPVGFLNPVLYKHAKDGVFNDVTVGNNNGFNAGPGWDATTGLGSIRGNALLAALKQDLQNPSDIV